MYNYFKKLKNRFENNLKAVFNLHLASTIQTNKFD